MPLKNRLVNDVNVPGQKKDPFASMPDLEWYFAFDAFEQRLHVLKRMIQGTDVIVLVLGEAGGGKTTLLNRFLASTEKVWKTGRVQTDSKVASETAPPTDAHGGYPVFMLGDSKDPIVIVDDAHTLYRPDLEILLREALVPGGARKIKQLVLFGEPSLRSTVIGLAEELAGEVALSHIHIPALSKDETAAYLHQRLANAGYSGKTPFDPADIQKIHNASGGLPGRINEMAAKFLQQIDSPKTPKEANLKKLSGRQLRVIGWTIAGICFFGLALLVYTQFQPAAVSEPKEQKPPERIFRAKMPPGEKPERVIREKMMAGEASATPKAAVAEVPKPTEVIQPPPVKPPKPIEAAPPAVEQTVRQQPVVTQAKEPTKAEEPAAVQSKDKPPEVKPLKSKAVTAEKEVKAKTINREKWLLAQNSSFYTLQILGVRDEETLQDFIKKYNLQAKDGLAYYRTTYKGKAWYPLLYGLYSTKKEAQSAIAELPEKIQKSSPWIRKMSAVQQAIQNTSTR